MKQTPLGVTLEQNEQGQTQLTPQPKKLKGFFITCNTLAIEEQEQYIDYNPVGEETFDKNIINEIYNKTSAEIQQALFSEESICFCQIINSKETGIRIPGEGVYAIHQKEDLDILMANIQNGIFEGKFFIYEAEPGELTATPLYTHYEQNGKYVSLFKYRLTNKD